MVVISHRFRLQFLALFVAAGMIHMCDCTQVSAERWTTLEGSRTVEADFVGMWGNNVVLQLSDGRRVSVDVDLLIAESRIKARRLGEQQQGQQADLIDGIKAMAVEAAAPAPNPIPKPPPAPAYQRLSSSGGILKQLEWMDEQSKNGHLLVAFDSLPLSYQDELQRLVRESLKKMNVANLETAMDSIHQIGDLIVTRQRWLFSHPRLDAIQPDAKETIETALLSIAGLIRDGFDPDQLDLDSIQTDSLRNWISRLDERVAPYILQLNESLSGDLAQETTFEVKEEKEGKATVDVTVNGQTQTLTWQNVEGFWVPEELATDWSGMVESWDKKLSETEDGDFLADSLLADGVALGMRSQVSAVIGPALEAQTAREFHGVMDGWFNSVGPLVQMAMSSLNLPGMGRRSQDYGDGMGEDYDMEMEMMEMQREMEEMQRNGPPF